ncbi:MAG: c-type cytochrome [Deltaproteobacteria bacterium]|nr:c-type cytochrome [Deltaproteobacteria bacterium]
MKRKGWLAGLGLTLLVSLAAAPPPQVSAPELAQRLGCWACHSLQGRGGQQGSPLDQIGARLTPEDLHAVLTHPRSRHPQAKMPSYAHLRPWEMQALVDYLTSLK